MSFFNRYAECCKLKGVAPMSQKAADTIGCSKSTISAFAKNQNIPKGDFVIGAAKMLDVSADYLLGLTDSPYPLDIENTLTQDETDLVSRYRKLNSRGKDAIKAALSGLETSENFTDE